MLLAILAGFIIAILCAPFGKWVKGTLSKYLFIVPLLIFLYFISFLPDVLSGKNVGFRYEWITTLGIHLDFYVDGLSLLFALLISGIGTLIFLYASYYLKGDKYLNRFFAYLSTFMAAMLGLVLSDNLLLLFIFWELTSISSFFLIGFNNDSKESRKSALLALSITGGGGFLLMGGVILLSYLSGTYSVQEMIMSNELIKSHALYALVVPLILAGAFTKSAQFPFHFWLPGAMKAPTPVSAYLHSATMVKAGVYLLARLTPVLGGMVMWNYTLMIIGGITMFFAAFHSIFRVDMKGVLAYSTIAALGILVFLIGIGTPESLLAASVFILVHALYKATLFLVTGVIDHETGTRDLTRLAGLRKVMMPLAIAGILAALSSAGLPLTYGFIGKDLIYEATLHYGGFVGWGITGLAVLTNVFLLYAGFLAGIKPFMGKLPQEFQAVHLPNWRMWVPPLILAVTGVILGFFPAVTNGLIGAVTFSMTQLTAITKLKIWHGFNLVLLLSVSTLVLGSLLYISRKVSEKGLIILSGLDQFAPITIFTRVKNGLYKMAAFTTRKLHNGFLRNYMLTIISFVVIVLGYKILTGKSIMLDFSKLHPVTFYELTLAGIMIVAIFLSAVTSSRLTAVVSMSVIGYTICLYFVLYSAPDLAMTQFAIDTLTVVLFVLVLFKLPPFLNFTNTKIKLRDGLISGAFGLIIGLIALSVLNEPVTKDISKFYADNSYVLAKGKNVVNVILVDFRGFDTMFEIIVLTMASIGVYSLLKLKVKSSERE